VKAASVKSEYCTAAKGGRRSVVVVSHLQVGPFGDQQQAGLGFITGGGASVVVVP
jgi:hypothetical protein